MVKKRFKIIWSDKAKIAIRDVYDFYKDKSVSGAKNVINDIIAGPKSITFSQQYQIDEINTDYRRIVVRDYKLLYKEFDNTIIVFDVICTLQSNDKQKLI